MQPQAKRFFQLLLFITLFFAGSYFHQPVDYDNTRSRFMLLSAMVDFHTFSIDKLQQKKYLHTIDASKYNGKYYSNKAPGTSLIAIPVYWMVKTIFPKRHNEMLPHSHRYLTNILTNCVLFAFLGVLLWRIGVFWSGDPLSSTLMVCAFSFGSIAWIHAQSFSGHLMAGAFCFFSFLLLYFLKMPDHKNTESLPVPLALSWIAGVFAGLGAICDFTAMYLALLLTGYAFWVNLRKSFIIAFILGGSASIILLGYYNLICFGSILSTSYHNLAYPEFAEGVKTGLLGIGFARISVLFLLLFSPSRGLFFIMPIFIFSLIGLVKMGKINSYRKELILIYAAIIGYLIINAGFYGWHGGWSYGPRYLVPLFPFLALPMVFSPLQSRSFILLLIISILLTLPGILVTPHTPPEFSNPIIEFIIPILKKGYLPDTWLSMLGVNKLTAVIIGFIIILCLMVTLLSVSRNIFPQKTHTHLKKPMYKDLLAMIVILSIIISLIYAHSPQNNRNIHNLFINKLYTNYLWNIQHPDMAF